MKKTPKKKSTGTGEVKTRRGKLLGSFLHGSILYFLISIVASLVVTGADMLNPQLIRFTVDSVIDGKESDLPVYADAVISMLGGADMIRARLWTIALAIVIIAFCAAIFRYLQRLYNVKASETLVERIRNLLFSHTLHLPFAWHMKHQTGDIIQRCTSDVETVKNFLSEQLTSVLRIVIQVSLSLYVMFEMDTRLALAASLSLSVVLVYSAIFGRKISRGFQKCDEAEGVLSAIAQENLTGVRVVRAFGREQYERDRFDAQNRQYTNLWLKLTKLTSAFWGFGDLIIGLQVMMIITLGVYACLDGRLTLGGLIAFITYNAMLAWPVRHLGRMISEMSKAGISIDRLGYILASPVEKDRKTVAQPNMHGDIVFDHVSFAYDGCPELLSDVSFTVKAGSTVGILGGTGSGKSTLIHLLGRLYPLPEDESGGKITIDGVNVADVAASYLRSNIGIVLQEPYLFSRSLASNIGITDKDISLDEIRKAARVACLDDTINSFTEGYDTFVGERGVTLSGGQKQRAAIARMLTQKTPIMVFDDSLSAVDAETDAKIRAALADELSDSTVFLISHRTATLMNADLILVLEHGKIIERGTHSELMQIENGIYQRIYNIQMSCPDDIDADTTDKKEVDA